MSSECGDSKQKGAVSPSKTTIIAVIYSIPAKLSASDVEIGEVVVLVTQRSTLDRSNEAMSQGRQSCTASLEQIG